MTVTLLEKDNTDSMKIFFNLNYSGETAGRMVKKCIKKLYKSFKPEINVKFVTHYKTTKILFFTNIKGKTPSLSQFLYYTSLHIWLQLYLYW